MGSEGGKTPVSVLVSLELKEEPGQKPELTKRKKKSIISCIFNKHMLQTTSYQVLSYVNSASPNPSLWLRSPFSMAHPQGRRHRALDGAGRAASQGRRCPSGEPGRTKPGNLLRRQAAIPFRAHPTGSVQGSAHGVLPHTVLVLSSDNRSPEGAENSLPPSSP